MAEKIYDLAVKTGTKPDGKGRYKNVGAFMKGDNGSFLMLDRTFSPSGVPNPENRDSVLISMFEPRQQNGQQGGQQPSQAGSGDDLSDIPF